MQTWGGEHIFWDTKYTFQRSWCVTPNAALFTKDWASGFEDYGPGQGLVGTTTEGTGEADQVAWSLDTALDVASIGAPCDLAGVCSAINKSSRFSVTSPVMKPSKGVAQRRSSEEVIVKSSYERSTSIASLS